jgi:hypothetical protein
MQCRQGERVANNPHRYGGARRTIEILLEILLDIVNAEQ